VGMLKTTPPAGLERCTDGRCWYIRTIRIYDPIFSLPPRLTDNRSRLQSRMRDPFLFHKRIYKRLKKGYTKRPFDALAKRLPPRTSTKPPTIPPRIDFPSQTDSQKKLISVGISFLLQRRLFFRLVTPILTCSLSKGFNTSGLPFGHAMAHIPI